MKPWEETWYPYEDTAGELDVYRDIDTEGSCVRVLASDSARDEDKARAKLAAAAPEMARLLKNAEFMPGDFYVIPRPLVLAVLRKAGVLGGTDT